MRALAYPLVALLAIVLAAAFSCQPSSTVGPSAGDDSGGGGSGDGSGGDDPDPTSPEHLYTFSISASATDPHVNVGAPAAGLYDLYFWLVCANYGVMHVQADFAVHKDEFDESGFFTPSEKVTAATWEELGELHASVQGCPTGETLLGTIHMIGSGSGGRVAMSSAVSRVGVVVCGAETELRPYCCFGYASDGSKPKVSHLHLSCYSAGDEPHELAVSASPEDPFVQTGEPEHGAYYLYLWSLSGQFTALEGDIQVDGGGASAAAFAAEPPFQRPNGSGGADVLLTGPGCSAGTLFLGTITLTGNGEGVSVTVVPVGDGVTDCADPSETATYTCRAYVSGGG
jgi:hypothetical protein